MVHSSLIRRFRVGLLCQVAFLQKPCSNFRYSSIRKVSEKHYKPVMSAPGAHVDVSSLVNKKGEFVRNVSSFRQSVSGK